MRTGHLNDVMWQLRSDHLSSDIAVCCCCCCLSSDFPRIILYSLSSLAHMATEVFAQFNDQLR